MQQGHHGALGQQVPTTEEQCALQLIIIFLLIFSRKVLQLIQIFSLENHQHHGEGDHDLDDQDDQDDHDLDSEGNWCRGQDGTPSVM